MAFVKAYNRQGDEQLVPEHFFDSPVLSRGLTRIPPAVVEEAAEAGEDVPSEEWTIARLRKYAGDHDISLGGASTKADVFAAITTHLSTTETPAAGENKE